MKATCGFSDPNASLTKSSSDKVNVVSAFTPLGSPSYNWPDFKSTAEMIIAVFVRFFMSFSWIALHTPIFHDFSILCDIEQEHGIDLLGHFQALGETIFNLAENCVAFKSTGTCSWDGWRCFLHFLQIDESTCNYLYTSLNDACLEMDACVVLPHFDFECLARNRWFCETNFNRFE